MRDLLIASTCLGAPALIGALMIHNYRAGETQNAVEAKRIDGTLVDVSRTDLADPEGPARRTLEQTTQPKRGPFARLFKGNAEQRV
jgi:hypothetical protein